MQNERSPFSRYIWLTAGLLVTLAIVFAIYGLSEKQIDRANDLRYQSILLADELRQSSDDLTRMARTYVVTGDLIYKQAYQDILAIRDGKKLRPDGYQGIYWDLVLVNEQQRHPGRGQAIGLLELMRQAGFTEQEFNKLAEAKANSDGLTATEFEAMKLAETTGPEAEASHAMARLMMYDDKYHQAKADIMKPINEFFALMDNRTFDAVQAAETKATIFRVVFIVFGLSLMVMLLRTNKVLHAILGGSVDEVYAHITKIGRGDFSSAIPIADDMKDSVLGRLAQTQTNLNEIERERKRAEDALRESETRHRLLFDGSRDALMTLAPPAWKFTSGNPAAVEMFKARDAAEFTALGPWEVSPERQPDGSPSADKAREAIEAALREGSNFFEWTHRRLGGADFPATVLLTRIELANQTFLQATVRDITVQKQVEEALRESEIRLRSITDSAQDAILMMDPEGRVSYWNPAAERILGYTNAEAIGQDLHSFIAPLRYHAAHQAAFPMFRQTGQGSVVGQTLDLNARGKDGREIPVQLSLSAIQIHGGWYAVGLLRDNTVQKWAEEELLETNRLLEQATARANDMAGQAERANAAKSEFLANMSHEIRTPLNGVIGMTGLLLDTELNAEQRHYAETVRTSSEALLALLNDILDFSKIEAGKLELETLDFDLRAVLDDFAAMLALRAHDKGLEFICAAAPDVPAYLRGDPGRLRQILTNLAGNAVKFTPQGEIAVRASLVSETDTDAVLRFSIKDTGIGIPAEQQKLLFQKFTQADASTTRQYGGTGLGLAISKQLVQRMDGEIGVSSEAGHGSEFWFTVQLGKQPAGAPTENLPPAGIRGAHVLVVDDNATNREVLLAQFAAWGLRAEEASNGPTALQALVRAREAGDPFRAAILDMQMPSMDGAALARAIKADATLKDTRLVLMTSLGQRGDAGRIEEIGFAAYLTKPVRQFELFHCLSAVLADTAVAQPAQTSVTRHTIRELRRGGARILVAEDSITSQQVALGILKKLGLRADAVANGAEAVKALENLPYDLVLMDVEMPEMDGYEATQQIRHLPSTVPNRRIPIIAMTAHAMPGDRERCLEAGMNEYVTKPIDPRALADALDQWLPQETAATNGPAPGVSEEAAAVFAQEPEPAVFDKAGMMARLMDDEDLARLVIQSLLDSTPRQIEALRGYLEAGDARGVRFQAHTIKGASAHVGGEALRAVAGEIENAGWAGDLDAVQARMADLDGQFIRLQAAIEKEI